MASRLQGLFAPKPSKAVSGAGRPARLEPRGAAATLRPNEEDDYGLDLESDNIESMLARRTAPPPTGKIAPFGVAEDDDDEDF